MLTLFPLPSQFPEQVKLALIYEMGEGSRANKPWTGTNSPSAPITCLIIGFNWKLLDKRPIKP